MTTPESPATEREEFAKALQDTPGLHQQWVNAPDPAEFAYTAAKNRIEFKELGNMEEYRAKVERELRAKIEAEFNEKQAKILKDRQDLPPTLSDVTGTAGPKAVWGGPESLSSILGGR